MNINWHIHYSPPDKAGSKKPAGFIANTLEAVIRNVGNGSKELTTYACQEIMAESYNQCPVDTGALQSSGWWTVQRRGDTKGYRYEGIMGYANSEFYGLNGSSVSPGGRLFKSSAGNGAVGFNTATRVSVGHGYFPNAADANATVNKRSGVPVKYYAARVHEDLSMPHRNGKKAKFLEDPVREFGALNFRTVAETYWHSAIEFGTVSYEYTHRSFGGRGKSFGTMKTAFITRKATKQNAAAHQQSKAAAKRKQTLKKAEEVKLAKAKEAAKAKQAENVKINEQAAKARQHNEAYAKAAGYKSLADYNKAYKEAQETWESVVKNSLGYVPGSSTKSSNGKSKKIRIVRGDYGWTT